MKPNPLKTARRLFTHPWRLFSLTALFLLIEFFDELHYALGGAALPDLQADLGLDYAQVGILLGLPHIIGAAIEWFVMLLGDTRLRKGLVVGGGAAVTLAILLIGSAQAFPIILGATILAFPASGAFVTLAQASLMDANPGREPQMMARWTLMGSLGNLLGPLALALILSLGFTWRTGYFALAVFAALLCLLVAFQSFPRQMHLEMGQDWRTQLKEMLAGIRLAFANLNLLRWLLLTEVADLLLDVFTSFAPLYFANVMGATTAQASLALSLMMAGSLLADVLAVPLLERFSGRTLVRVTAPLAGLFFVAWLLVPGLPAKIALAFLVKVFTLGWYAVLKGEAYAAAPGRSGTVNALNSLTGLVSGFIPWSIGWVAAQTSLHTALWLLLLAPVCLLLWTPRKSAVL